MERNRSDLLDRFLMPLFKRLCNEVDRPGISQRTLHRYFSPRNLTWAMSWAVRLVIDPDRSGERDRVEATARLALYQVLSAARNAGAEQEGPDRLERLMDMRLEAVLSQFESDHEKDVYKHVLRPDRRGSNLSLGISAVCWGQLTPETQAEAERFVRSYLASLIDSSPKLGGDRDA